MNQPHLPGYVCNKTIACRRCAIESARRELEAIPEHRMTETLRRHRDALKRPKLALIKGGGR